jgi:hypothetical protein
LRSAREVLAAHTAGGTAWWALKSATAIADDGGVESAGPRRILILLGAILASLLVAVPAFGAPGTKLVVTNLNDSGPGSLRAAIAAPVAPHDPHLISFAAGVRGQITLTSPLNVQGSDIVIIEGPGIAGIRLSGGDNSRVFEVGENAALELIDVTVSHGRAVGRAVAGRAERGGTGEGGAILNLGQTVLKNTVLTDNAAIGGESAHGPGGAGYGGAILNRGQLWIYRTLFTGNVARGSGEHEQYYVENSLLGGDAAGGAIRNEGKLEIHHAEFADNSAIGGDGTVYIVPIGGVFGTAGGSGLGGAIYDGSGSGKLEVADSTFAGNSALGGSIGGGQLLFDKTGDAGGGAIFSASGRLLLADSTVVNNKAVLGRQNPEKPAVLGAGGLELQAGAQMLRSDTIVADPGSADVGTSSPVPTLNTIVGSCSGAGLSSLGFDLDVHGSCNLTGATDLRNVDPGLGALAYAGGTIRTVPLTADSPALDNGNTGDETLDERGAKRPVRVTDHPLPPGGNAGDIGAFELQGLPKLHYDLRPEHLVLGSVKVGSTSKFVEATLVNDGNLPFHVGGVKIGGADIDEFAISSETCANADLGPGDSCHLRVRFSPEEVGERNAMVTITAEKIGPIVLSLSGTGIKDAGEDYQPAL